MAGYRLFLWLAPFAFLTCIKAFIPAVATNNVSTIVDSGSSITLEWFGGAYNEGISFQLVGKNSTGISKGAIVHFAEDNSSQSPTTTPWIAFVSCDRNATNYTLENDIFTMARDAGAVAALLYTTTSQGCLINPEYADPASFDQILDIYTTIKMSSAKLIESQFNNVNGTYYSYNSQRLNNSNDQVGFYQSSGFARPGFLLATLNANSSSSGSPSNGPGNGGGASTNNNPKAPNTNLAMIILYAITGMVSALFCIVILSGAIRAFRHPERYGPRAGNPHTYGRGAVPQSRTAGLGRAMLDSFPLIKFGGGPNNNAEVTTPERPTKDVDLEHGSHTEADEHMEMEGNRNGDRRFSHAGSSTHPDQLENDIGEVRYASMALDETGSAHAERDSPVSRDGHHPSTEAGTAPPQKTPDGVEPLDPAAIGHETCPICIVDFVNGDDIRVLPCAGHHQFHKDCVDPWLLELSSSCPICREDFHVLEEMAAGNAPPAGDDAESSAPTGVVGSRARRPTSNAHRFSRYLHFAQKRRNGAAENQTEVEGESSSTQQSPSSPSSAPLDDHVYAPTADHARPQDTTR